MNQLPTTNAPLGHIQMQNNFSATSLGDESMNTKRTNKSIKRLTREDNEEENDTNRVQVEDASDIEQGKLLQQQPL